MKYTVNGKTIALESSPVSLESILDTSEVDKAFKEANKAIEAFSIVSNVKAMESFGYKSTEGFAEKLKAGAKVVLNGIKAFFKKIWEFITSAAKLITSLFKRKNKNTDKIVGAAIKTAKEPNEIVPKVVEGIVDEMKSKGVVLTSKTSDNTKYGEAPKQLTFNHPEGETEEYSIPTEKQEAYDTMYALLSAKLGAGGNVGYSDEFSEMVYWITFVNLVTWHFELPNFVKHDCQRNDVTEFLSVISINFKKHETNLKVGDTFYKTNEALFEKYIECIDEASETYKHCSAPANSTAYDRYSSDKKDMLSKICRNGFDGYINEIKRKIENVENVSGFLQDLVDEKDFNDTASLLFSKLYKFQLNVVKDFKQALTATLKVASFVNKTNEILNKIENAGKDTIKKLN